MSNVIIYQRGCLQFQGGNGRGSERVEGFPFLKILLSSLPIQYSAYNVLLIISASSYNFVFTSWQGADGKDSFGALH